MIEAETNDVQMPERTQPVSNDTESLNQPGAQTTQALEAPSAETEQAGHFKRLRVAKEEEERKRILAERERDEAVAELNQSRQPKQPIKEVENDEWNFGEDEDLAEVKHLKKMAKALKAQQEELKKYKQQSTEQTAQARLKAEFPDIDKVLSPENIKALEDQHPELSYSIQSNQDVYSRYASAYKMMKEFGIYKEDKFVADRAKAEANAGKPRPLTSVSPQQGDSPLSRANAFANGLTDELKTQLMKEMQDARKNY